MSRGRRLTLLLAALVLGAGCGGGGGGGTPTQPPPAPPPPPPMGVFFSSASSPGEPGIYLDAAEESPLDALFELRVEASAVVDLYGLAFQVRFPEDLLSFRPNQIEEGDFLDKGGAVETELLTRRSGDLVTVGLTRLGAEPGAEGSGHLLTLRFALREGAAGVGELAFERNDTRDSSGALQAGVEWTGGEIEVLR